MPTTTKETPRRATRTSGRSRGSTATNKIAKPAEPDYASIEDAPRYVGELRIVSDVPMPSPLPVKKGQKPIVFSGFRVLTLEDQSVVYGCGECTDSTDFTGSRAEVRSHRVANHGMKNGGNPGNGRRNADAPIPGLVPLTIRAMTLDELLSMAAEMEQIGDVVVGLTAERDEYKARANAAETQVRRWERAFAQLGLTRENVA